MSENNSKKTYLIDMDGVLVHGDSVIPGAPEFIERLKKNGNKFLVLTNNSRYTPQDLHHRLTRVGFDIEVETIDQVLKSLMQKGIILKSYDKEYQEDRFILKTVKE